MAFWAGVGGTVILPIPDITGVSTASCDHFTKCPASNLNSTLFNSTFDSTTTSSVLTTITGMTSIPANTSFMTTAVLYNATSDAQDDYL